MKTKLSEYIADFLVQHEVKHIFTITGGGAMHLNDSLGHKRGLTCVYNHHEQACAIAAEAYARFSGKIAAVCVTSGPGGTNAITGVLGGWLDSIPMLVISGQVKRATTTWAVDIPLRQLGDQEYNIVASVEPMTKYAVMVTEPEKIRYHLEKALYLAINGRPGPVWLDIPLDVQAAVIDTEELEGFSEEEPEKKENPFFDRNLLPEILGRVFKAQRPVILAGTGIRIADAYPEFVKAVERLQIPVVTAWNAHDLLWQGHPLDCGRPGTVGTRGGNFVVQKSDLLISLGCRLNIRMISYNDHDFARNAYKIIVDIDENELRKPTITPDLPVHADVRDVLKAIAESGYESNPAHKRWLEWCQGIHKRYPAVLPEYYDKKSPVNPYAFMKELSKQMKEGDSVICGNGSACVISFQAMELKKGQRMFTNSGCAAMGYGFPAAIGVCVADHGKQTICIDGDGSFQMNLQELQTVVYNRLNIKIIYLNNNGYHSIRQTQTNLFQPPLVGVCDGNGLSFPDMERIAWAYGIPFCRIKNIDEAAEELKKMFETDGPFICEVVVDENQIFSPKLSSKVLEDGRIVSPPMEDMYPFLPKEELERVMKEEI